MPASGSTACIGGSSTVAACRRIAAISASVLLVIGDRDFTTVEHGALMLELIPGSQLAVLPDTTHMQVTRRADVLLPMLDRFLD
jgi:pimeloyl-ACP methyl ester carboxylesterase